MRKRGFYNFRLFDGVSDGISTNRIIRVNGDRIEGVDNLVEREQYPEYEWIDLSGWTLMPGLIDAHIHITVPFISRFTLKALLQTNAQLSKNFHNCVKYGVTTVRDVGACPKNINRWRKKIVSGKAAGPRIVAANSFITSRDGVPEMVPTFNFFEAMMAGGQFAERLSDPAEVKRVADRLIDDGADWLKTQYSENSFLFHGKLGNLSDDCFRILRQTADTRGVGLAMHHTESVGFKKGIQVGADSLEHSATDVLDQRDIDAFVERNMGIVPTLKVLHDSLEIESILSWLSGDGKKDFMPEPFRQSIRDVERLLQKPYPPQDYMDNFYPDIDFFKSSYPVAMKNVERIKASGGKVGIGTDTCGTGLSFFGSYHKELEHLTQAGFSNSEALKAATSINADIIGMSDQVGSIEPGKYADFTVVEGDPLTDVKNVRNIQLVIKGGEIVVDRSLPRR